MLFLPWAAVPNFWTFVLPAWLGGLSIFLLLPRPRPYPVWAGVLCCAAALLLGGFVLIPPGHVTPPMLPQTILFYAFSALAIIFGSLLVTQNHPARAALSFTVVVLSTCGLFLLLAAPFLMAATIIIYAGAIIVTFLFVLMLAQQSGYSDADARSREPLLTTATGFVLLGVLLYVLNVSYNTSDLDHLFAQARPDLNALVQRTDDALAQNQTNGILKVVGEAGQQNELFAAYSNFFQAHGWTDLSNQVNTLRDDDWDKELDKPTPQGLKEVLERLKKIGTEGFADRRKVMYNQLSWAEPPGNLPLSNLSGPPANVGAEQLRRNDDGLPQLPQDNTANLGRSLFTDYLLPVELGGTLLLVATIGAIAIAHRRIESKSDKSR
jgi:NADH-quinone oxidoreductase subunit J